jgi:hypothetical protein
MSSEVIVWNDWRATASIIDRQRQLMVGSACRVTVQDLAGG